MKTESVATRDLSGALAQLTARVDRVDHDQSARLDKLADRIDHESTARIADLVTRLDKLEKKAVVATAAPPPSPRQAAATAKPDPVVSNETTGSIEKPRPALRGYWVVEVQDGVAFVDGRDGPQQVAPGDVLPGAGRVERIERRGHEWVVVTSSGIDRQRSGAVLSRGRLPDRAGSPPARRTRTTMSTRAISHPSGALGNRASATWSSGISTSASVSSIRK